MSTGREIRTKINSIKNTQKITRAMELVAASKMRKAQVRMHTTRPYASKIRQVISHVAKSHSEYQHPYLSQREEIKKVGLIVVSTDRGLCGPLNVNLFKLAALQMRDWQQQAINVDVCTIGIKAEHFFQRLGGHVVASANHLGDAPKIKDLIGLVKIMLDAYDQAELDGLYIVFNEFINTMTQKPKMERLLPLDIAEEEGQAGYWDYIYEPDAKPLLTALLVRYIETLVYQSVVENIASEQAARMVAMKNATDNAGKLIDELQLIYNKARQAAITQEISEIVAGAQAVE